MKKKTLLTLITGVALVASAASLAACTPKDGDDKDPVKYTVTYVSGAANVTENAPATASYAEGETFTVSENTFTYEGYTFTGWNDGTTSYQAKATYTMPAKNVTFTAQWNKNEEQEKPPVIDPEPEKPTTYAITFVGGTGATGTAPTIEAKEEGAKITLPANAFTRTGYTFTGWNDGTKTYAAGAEYTVPAKAVTFTAQWKKNEEKPEPGDPTVKKYTITFVKASNDSLIDSVQGDAPTIENKAAGATVTLPECELTLPHYTFSTWRVQHFVVDSTGEAGWENIEGTFNYKGGDEFTMPAENIRILAVWTANYITVKFNANGGSGEMANLTNAVQYNGTASISTGSKFKNKFTAPAGKEFEGWSLTPNGAVIDGGLKMTEEVVGENDVLTLYAIWKDKDAPVIPVDPLENLTGSWTTSDSAHSIIIVSGSDEEYVIGYGILDGKTFIRLFDYETMVGGLSSNDEHLYYISLNGSNLQVIEDETDTYVFSGKTAVTNSTLSDFAGKWDKTVTGIAGTSLQHWYISDTEVLYNASLQKANYIVIGNYLVLLFNAGDYEYVHVLEKDGATLKGYYGVFEKPLAETTFEAGNYNVLIVEGKVNQFVESGNAPDATKVTAPVAPEGQVFSKWVLTGTQTEFDVSALMTEDASITATFVPASSSVKVFKGKVGSGFFAKDVTVTIDTDTCEVKFEYGTTVLTSTAELQDGKYKVTGRDNHPYDDATSIWLIISEDGSSMDIYDDWNGVPDEFKGTFDAD